MLGPSDAIKKEQAHEGRPRKGNCFAYTLPCSADRAKNCTAGLFDGNSEGARARRGNKDGKVLHPHIVLATTAQHHAAYHRQNQAVEQGGGKARRGNKKLLIHTLCCDSRGGGHAVVRQQQGCQTRSRSRTKGGPKRNQCAHAGLLRQQEAPCHTVSQQKKGRHRRRYTLQLIGSLVSPFQEMDYYSKAGEYRIDSSASPAMLNSLMYKMSYYRFGEVYTEQGARKWRETRDAGFCCCVCARVWGQRDMEIVRGLLVHLLVLVLHLCPACQSDRSWGHDGH